MPLQSGSFDLNSTFTEFCGNTAAKLITAYHVEITVFFKSLCFFEVFSIVKFTNNQSELLSIRW